MGIKETPELANTLLLKQPRLSVMPLTKAEFELIIKLAN
ncbi:EVE domain-containing protein [Dolichospermum compactum]|nr:EVE domain-containing protein [Dolichospermum compactum]